MLMETTSNKMESSSSSHPRMYMYRRIVEAKLFIDSHFADKIDLDNISNQASFSKYHFLRLFKASFGRSPHQYLTQVRLQEARKLLKNNASVTEVCFAVGFESIPSFTRLFKRHNGISPKEYAQQEAVKRSQQAIDPFAFVPGCFAKSYGWQK